MRFILFVTFSLLLAESARAQYLREYLFIAPTPNNGISNSSSPFGILPAQPTTTPLGASNNSYTAGVGLEQGLGKHLGAGLDLAGIMPGSGKIINDTIGVISPNGYVHLWSSSTTDLYGTAGYSLLFRDFSANGFNAGAGVNYWFRDNVGLTVELRVLKVLGSHPPTPNTEYYQIRVGLTFR